jgi:hypothetical protein
MVDDIMIYSKSFEEYIKHIEKVLMKSEEINAIIKLKKYEFGKRNIEFLGHIVGKDGLQLEVKKVKKIKNMKKPESVTEVRSFLGLCSYYPLNRK